MSKITFIYIFILGLSFGSFFNVIRFRYPKSISLVRPASFCPNCNHKIPFYLNIPIISWIYLRGKCKVIWMTLGRLPRGNNFWRDLCHPYYIGEHKWIVDGNKCPKYDKPGFTGTHPNAVGHKNIANYLLERL